MNELSLEAWRARRRNLRFQSSEKFSNLHFITRVWRAEQSDTRRCNTTTQPKQSNGAT